MRKIISYLKYVLKREISFFKLLKEKTGIGFSEYYDLSLAGHSDRVSLLNNEIKISDMFWHVHSLNELFVDEIYKSKFKNTHPLILDCGSNVGLSIIYFKQKFPDARVVGFEPDSMIFNMMKINLAKFDFKDVQIHNKAVWTSEGELTFNASGALGGALDTSGGSVLGGNIVTVGTLRLRDFLVDNHVELLKIDVEGAEFEILDDCLDALHNVENIFIEYHRPRGGQQHIGSYLSKLENAGFRLYIKEAWNNLPHPFCYDDYNPMYDLQLNIFGFRK